MSAIAIITARGGSKRIPKKNIREFCGKPIIAYSIEAALKSGLFDEVMVSTDSKEIAEIARQFGAKVPFMRSIENSNDFATTAQVLDEVLTCYAKTGTHFDIMCCIYPTAPFVTAEKLKEAMNNLLESDADSLVPVVKFGFPPQRAVTIKAGQLQYLYPEYEFVRSQDLEPHYHDCGQFYICKTAAFKEHQSLFAGKTIPFVLPEEEVQDIDHLSDWVLAEAKYRTFILQNRYGYGEQG